MLDIHTLPAQMVLYQDAGLPGRGICRGCTQALLLTPSYEQDGVRQDNRATVLSPSEKKNPTKNLLAKPWHSPTLVK